MSKLLKIIRRLVNTTNSNTVPAGHTDIYSKSDGGIYKKNGTVEVKLLDANDDGTNNWVVGSGYVGVETPPVNGQLIQGFLGLAGITSAQTGLHHGGGVAFKHGNETASYTLTDSDFWVSFSGIGLTATLPEFGGETIQNQLFLIKNFDSSNNLTVATSGASKIDGSDSVTLQAKESALFCWGGSNWQILLHFDGVI